jgi:hypothetical protein
MKILSQSKSLRGNTLILTIVVTGLVGFLLASYMGLVKSQNIATMRSQSWNATIPVIEAGLEDALTHINLRITNDLTGDGWAKQGSIYVTKRWIGPNYYTVTISNWVVGSVTNNPVLESRGYVLAPVTVASAGGPMLAAVTLVPRQFVARGIRCNARTDPLFSKGLVAKGRIDMNGNDISADSYDSRNTNYSTGGKYDVTKRKDGGSIATNSGLTNSLNVGNANIYGKVSTGPGGSIDIGSGGVVGDTAWNTNSANQGTVKPGWSTDDMNVDFGDVKPPYTSGGWSLSAGPYMGTNYTYKLDTGNYQHSTQLSMGGQDIMIVTGDAVLYLPAGISLSGQSKIIIVPGASLKVYAGGSSSFSGNGIVNQNDDPLAFSYWGLPSNTSVSITGNGAFTGTIYAPNADLRFTGGGSSPEDFSGAAIGRTVTMNGHFKFHYDESLRIVGPPRGYVVTTWNEMKPDEVAAGPSL